MLIRGATLPDGRRRDVLIDDDRIAAVDADLEGSPVLDAAGLHLLPGAIDVHVHVREPGGAHKETWPTATRAAAAGGVTTVVDQPNTEPPTVDARRVRQKLAMARGRAVVDFAINGGVTANWRPQELLEAPIAALGEIFMADSTGEMGVEGAQFEAALRVAAEHDRLVTVHAEDDGLFDDTVRDRTDPAAWSDYRPAAAEIVAVRRALEVANATGARCHIAHASTPEAVDAVADADATCEVTPHHLLLSRADLDELGTFGRMNPPLRDEARRSALVDRLRSGAIDVVATDHAPHTVAEKDADIWSAPSGVPGVETMVPLLLALVRTGELSIDRVADVTARTPAARFGFERKGRIAPDYAADLALYDLDAVVEVDADDLVTACGWTPFDGHEAVFPTLTLVRGRPAFRSPAIASALPPAMAGPRFGPPRGHNVVDQSSS